MARQEYGENRDTDKVRFCIIQTDKIWGKGGAHFNGIIDWHQFKVVYWSPFLTVMLIQQQSCLNDLLQGHCFNEVNSFVSLCNDNFLGVNVSKTKELAMDFRMSKNQFGLLEMKKKIRLLQQ